MSEITFQATPCKARALANSSDYDHSGRLLFHIESGGVLDGHLFAGSFFSCKMSTMDGATIDKVFLVGGDVDVLG